MCFTVKHLFGAEWHFVVQLSISIKLLILNNASEQYKTVIDMTAFISVFTCRPFNNICLHIVRRTAKINTKPS